MESVYTTLQYIMLYPLSTHTFAAISSCGLRRQ